MAIIIATECFDRTWRKGLPVTLAIWRVTSGLAHRALGQVNPPIKALLAEAGQLRGMKVVTFLASKVIRSNRSGGPALVVTLACSVGGTYPVSPTSDSLSVSISFFIYTFLFV